jgi:pilus assembly protein CpaF
VAELSPRELVRTRVEHALASEQVNLTSTSGRTRADELIEQVLRNYQAEALSGDGDGSSELVEQLRRELRDDLIGLGAIAERMLSDPDVQEWMVNAPTRVFRDTGERLERAPDVTFTDDRQVRAFLDRLLEQVEGKRLDRITPRIEARLPDGSRLTAAIPPVSSNGHVICSIRRFRLKANSLNDLVGLDFLSQRAADFLAACVQAGKNIVVAGRVSSGKTTLLNALGRAVPASERFVCCESSAELQLPAILANCIGYEARPGNADGLPPITLEDLVSDALRMNPDRIVVGECRGPETMATLWAFATGHAGMTSVHGESAEHALRNLVRFALTSGAHVDPQQALDWLRDIDLVIHCDRPRTFRDGERAYLPRQIDQIVELTGIEGNTPTLNPLFEGAGSSLRYLRSGPAFLPDLQAAGFQS